MNFDIKLLDALTEEARQSPRLRMNLDMRTSPADQSQRMLNALEPGTELPIHRHMKSTETVVVLRGKLAQHIYDGEGNELECIVLEAGGPIAGMSVEVGCWHKLECLQSGSVIFESKDGPFEPICGDNILIV